jgi:hypothetical protein
LRYFRDVDRCEVDFEVTENGSPIHIGKVKQRAKSVSGDLRCLKTRFPEVAAVQLYHGDGQDRVDRGGIRICPAHRFLSELVRFY